MADILSLSSALIVSLSMVNVMPLLVFLLVADFSLKPGERFHVWRSWDPFSDVFYWAWLMPRDHGSCLQLVIF